jgi:TRAP-type mannitol/chloroaromatic compound transport system permease large subunit
VITVILGILAVIGVPLFVVIAVGALWGYHESGIDLQAIAIEIFGVAEMPILSAIPLFTFAGYLISEGGAPGRLVRISQTLLGWMPGGLALISLAGCAIFTAFTGDLRQSRAAVRTVIAADSLRCRGQGFDR